MDNNLLISDMYCYILTIQCPLGFAYQCCKWSFISARNIKGKSLICDIAGFYQQNKQKINCQVCFTKRILFIRNKRPCGAKT